MSAQMAAARQGKSTFVPGVERRGGVVQALLLCGAAAFVLYVALDAVSALRYDGYSYRSQTISELSAIGAPTRGLWVVFGAVYGLLTLAFALGTWLAAGTSLRLRLMGALLFMWSALALCAWPFAPMHQREILAAGGSDVRDTMHLVLASVDSVLSMAVVVLGAGLFGRRFRWYSLATLALMLVFGMVTGMQAPDVQDNGSTPWLGIAERITVFGSMLWMAVLALGLVRRQRTE